MNKQENHTIRVKDRSSIGVGFPKSNMRNMDMERYDAETWHCKSVEYILRKHIAYDKTNDAIVVMYPLVDKPWKKHHYSLFLESLCSPEAAARAFKRISIKPWWSERVGDAIKEAQRKVVTGNMDGLRVIEREVMRRAYHR